MEGNGEPDLARLLHQFAGDDGLLRDAPFFNMSAQSAARQTDATRYSKPSSRPTASVLPAGASLGSAWMFQCVTSFAP